MGYDDPNEYEYEDEDYYDDDEDYLDYTEDIDEESSSRSSMRSRITPFSGGSGLPGSSSSSRFGSSSSRFGSSSKSTDDDETSSSSSSRFGSSGGISSRFSSSSSSSDSGSSRFGGTTSSRFGNSSSKSDSGSGSTSSRFGSSSGSDSGSGSTSRFGNSSSSSSRFGSSSRFSGTSSPAEKKSPQSPTPAPKSASNKPADDDEKSGGFNLGGMIGNLREKLPIGGGDEGDKKPADKGDSGGGVMASLGGLLSRDKKEGDKKTPAKDGEKSTNLLASVKGALPFGGSKDGDKKPANKPASQSSKAGNDEKKGGSRFGFLNRGKSEDDKAGKSSTKPPPPATKSASKANNKDEQSGGFLSGLTRAFSFGKDDKASSATTTKKASTPKVPTANTSDGLTLDNWLDIIGVGLVVVALVLFFSGLSREQAAIGAIHTTLGQLFGWGAIVAPITMFIVGVWLIVRHFGEEAPTVDPIRVSGAVMVFIASLYFLQWYDSFGYVGITADDGTTTRMLLRARLNIAWQDQLSGGGVIGAELYYFMVTTVTEIGGFLLMSFLALVGIMFITRMSAAEILRAVAGITLAIRENMKQRAIQRRAERQLATQQAAEAQLATAGNAPPAPTSAPSADASAQADALGREIRMTVGGHAETVSMNGQQGAPQPSYGPPVQSMPMQPASDQNNNGNGLFGRLSLFGRSGNNQTEASPPPPATLPQMPLPMDDGYSHFDTGPFKPVARPTQAVPSSSTPTPEAEAQTPDLPPMPDSVPDAENEPQPSAEARAKREVNDYLQQRQERLDKLRKGEIGPISQSAMARARTQDVSSVFIPSSEGEREQAFEASNEVEDADFTPPSKLPSVQADGDTAPKQQMLAVPVDKPKSSEVTSNKVKINWRLPDYRTLLSSGSEQEFDREYLLKQARIIEETLESFGAQGRVVEVNTGPVITQFGVEPDYISGRGGRKQRVKVSAIASLDKDLQLALGARSIRVEAPVPGKGYVGVEVPNAESTLVSLRDVMDSASFAKHKSPLAIALGQSVSGAPISADLSSMPHLLIAGTTGSGKSVCVNSIIASIISRNTPDQVKFIMVDPKRVELTGYNGIPHLVAPVVVELERIVGVLKWVTREMDARYKQFSEAGARNIEDFNKHRNPNTTEQMPYMVVIIDELADLMMLAPEETERTITRIAALARATGIHLVIATQRPSVDVVTGLIKANFPARIAFAVAGSVDSRVILDQPGAERLLGKGDMLYLSGDSPAPLRLQGVYVSDMEINNIVRYWKMQGLKQPEAARTSALSSNFVVEKTPVASPPSASTSTWSGGDMDDNDDLPLFASARQNDSDEVELTKQELTGDVKEGNEDELYDKAVDLVRRLDKASISLLQRRLRIGYTRAARLIDVMEARGVVGPAKDGSSKPRDVLPE